MHWVRAAFRRTLNRLDDITDYRTSLVGPKADLTIGANDIRFCHEQRTWWLLVVLLVPEGHEPLTSLILRHHGEHFGACLGHPI